MVSQSILGYSVVGPITTQFIKDTFLISKARGDWKWKKDIIK
jgi:hypothetical protein